MISIITEICTSFNYNNSIWVRWKCLNESGVLRYSIRRIKNGVIISECDNFANPVGPGKLNGILDEYKISDGEELYYQVVVIFKNGQKGYSKICKCVGGSPTGTPQNNITYVIPNRNFNFKKVLELEMKRKRKETPIIQRILNFFQNLFKNNEEVKIQPIETPKPVEVVKPIDKEKVREDRLKELEKYSEEFKERVKPKQTGISDKDLVKSLTKEMEMCVEKEDYERAAQLRDKINSVKYNLK